MHSRQTHKQHTSHSRINSHRRMGSRTRRFYANRSVARITTKWGLRKYHYSNRCIFEICSRLSSLQPHSSKHSESHVRHYDKTRLLTQTHYLDKGSVFDSQVTHEVAEILGINLKHAATKHAETIGVLERAHATIKTSLKKASAEYRKQWPKYLPIAILNYSIAYHSSINCQPSRMFHGRVPHNFLDHKLGLRFNPNIAPTTDFAQELLRRTKFLYDKTEKNVIHLYIKYKKYSDKKKAKTSPLKQKDYCFILQPKADYQWSKTSHRDFRWFGPHLVEKVLPNNNYIVR